MCEINSSIGDGDGESGDGEGESGDHDRERADRTAEPHAEPAPPSACSAGGAGSGEVDDGDWVPV
jgi:hypothetical protein